MGILQFFILVVLFSEAKCKGSGGYATTRSYSQPGSASYSMRRTGGFIYLGGFRRYGGSYTGKDYNQYASAAGYQVYGVCDPGSIELQANRTKNWIIVQVGSTNSTFDPGQFEIDAFREFTWRSACHPPTQVLVIQSCSLPDTKKITAVEQDNPAICERFGTETSGSSFSAHRAAARKLMSVTDTRVVEFYVGSSNDDTAGYLTEKIQESLNDPNSQLRLAHQLTHLLSINVDYGVTNERDDLNKKATLLVLITCGYILAVVIAVAAFSVWAYKKSRSSQ